MCTELLPPGGYQTAVNKYVISYNVICYKYIFVCFKHANGPKLTLSNVLER
jgi:hypothetical protein